MVVRRCHTATEEGGTSMSNGGTSEETPLAIGTRMVKAEEEEEEDGTEPRTVAVGAEGGEEGDAVRDAARDAVRDAARDAARDAECNYREGLRERCFREGLCVDRRR
eukprot:GHVU01081346.1.p2 GENE.GHVU01081346.1~~GHVU01081346.1.p2  ORF type:complete len:107 (+),score=19.71 GHVU01081346.1:284-604(+)